ncbi:NAD(P)H-hydrate dehydratase [Solimonas terrae]|uniref:Bifunctional NAD(P)H-hydrate repair enzyme n=1 Tax=Solimonas terrae TaxID=1396819 RepID=A0A6M2BNH5_9GAMM|nr:NAD(P)H-hydrate dehydratase [Solimonas terrae]NGY03607.1 NAD(P)H-hydrate dehydratase [Solimonas terrae]
MPDSSLFLYTAAQVRELDRRAVASMGISGYDLMQRAARACWREIAGHCRPASVIVVLCGSGNNGGDGYEIARLAMADGHVVHVCAVEGVPQGGDAGHAHAAWLGDGGAVAAFAGVLPDCDWVVDALFGTGLSRKLSGEALAAVAATRAARQHGARVLAVDVPSGLDASTGDVPSGEAVQADVTVSFIARKLGLFTGQGPAVSGARHFDALVEPQNQDGDIQPVARLLAESELQTQLRPRSRVAHKGDHGRVLIVGGNHGMMGAVLIAARAALRAGAGLVMVATRQEHVAAITAAQPELMCHGCDDATPLRPLLHTADVVAIGPGLGTDSWARALWSSVLDSCKPSVIDADALNLLAIEPTTPTDAILTPHPGEAARLLGCRTAEVQADRLAALHAIERRYGATVVLKGAGSLISGRQTPVLCPYGNPGMAVAGMGDALTGIVAALRGQGLDVCEAAQIGVLVHALAADHAAVQGERGLLPSDVIDRLRALVNRGDH